MKTNLMTPGKVMMASAIVLAGLGLAVDPVVGLAISGLWGFLGAVVSYIHD